MQKIGFWLNRDDNYRSTKTGLTKEQIEFLHSLNEGDTLILWNEAEGKEKMSQPDLRLAKGKNV